MFRFLARADQALQVTDPSSIYIFGVVCYGEFARKYFQPSHREPHNGLGADHARKASEEEVACG